MQIKPIKTDVDYAAALSRIDALSEAQVNTPEGDELEVLLTLVTAYEEKVFVNEAPDPVEAIRFRMEQLGLMPIDMLPYLGRASRVSEVLNRRRRLTLQMIRKLHEGLHIPYASLIGEYELER